MTMEWEQLYAAGIADCKHPEQIEKAAYAVAAALLANEPIEISLAPGNGTRYAWLFVPFDATRKVGAGDRLESGSTAPPGVWIADLNGAGGIYPLSFGGGREVPHPTYLSEKWLANRWSFDLVVFYELLRQILDQMNSDDGDLTSYDVTIWFQPDDEGRDSWTITVKAEDEDRAIAQAEALNILGYSAEPSEVTAK